jgi:hypothetical protein
VLTYTTTASKSLMTDYTPYLQMAVFDTLDPHGIWTSDYPQGEVGATGLPLPQGLSNSGNLLQFTTHVTVPTNGLVIPGFPTFLAMPYPAAKVASPPGYWLSDPELMVYSKDNAAPVKTYQAISYAVTPSKQNLINAAPISANLSADLALPASYRNNALQQIAERETENATTNYQKVADLAAWLSGPSFHYKLNEPQINSPDDLLKFLTQTKAGVCVQFAYAMTVLTRLLGIPARLATGYTAGTLVSGDKYVVKNTDAHAWTEVYFSGWGWIRFEATQTGPDGQGTATQPAYMTGAGGGSTPPTGPPSTPSSVGGTGGPGSHGGNTGPRINNNDSGGSGPSTTAAQSAGTPWAAVVLAVLAAIALACGVIAILAPPAQRLMSSHPAEAARRRSPVSPATVGVVAVVAAIVALSLYRLLSHTSGLDLRAGWATVGIAFGAAGAVILVGPAILRIVLRRWRWMRARDDASRAHTAWREFGYDLEDLGFGRRPSEPPRTLAGRVSSGLREPAQDAIRRIALAEERASYAARPAESATLRKDGVTARRGVAAAARRGSRWRARIFPVSVLANVADGAARLPDRLGALIPRRTAERRSAS